LEDGLGETEGLESGASPVSDLALPAAAPLSAAVPEFMVGRVFP
jgi:hypothetical protein